MSIRALVLNDVHAAGSPPLGATDAYPQDIINMLDEARHYAIDNQCQYTILTGDLFHAKRNVPYWLTRKLLQMFGSWPGRKLAICGNHDLGYGGLASVEHQPIGVLFTARAIEWLREDTFVKHDGITVQWSPANYRDDIDHDPANYSLTREDGVDWAVKVAHGTITPPGKPFPFHTVPMNTIPTDGMDLVLYGHPHYDVGIETVNGCTFACLGSIGRTQRTEENLTRDMRLLMVEFTKDTMDFTELPLLSAAKPADLFLAKESADDTDISAALKRFVGSIEAAIALEDGDSLDAVMASLGGDIDDRAKKCLVSYLSEAGFDG